MQFGDDVIVPCGNDDEQSVHTSKRAKTEVEAVTVTSHVSSDGAENADNDDDDAADGSCSSLENVEDASVLETTVVALAQDVFGELGPGLPERCYQKALAVALRGVGLGVQEEVCIPVCFRGETVGNIRADLLIEAVYPLLHNVSVSIALHNQISGTVHVQLLVKAKPPTKKEQIVVELKRNASRITSVHEAQAQAYASRLGTPALVVNFGPVGVQAKRVRVGFVTPR